MVGEVFLLGHWKDYDELESSLSMPELAATLKAIYDTENRRQKFMAALQGVDIEKDSSPAVENASVPTVEQIQARAMARLSGDQNALHAANQGIVPEMGIEYKLVGGTEFG